MITQEVKLRIHEESDLFSPFDPDQTMLSDEVISYLNRNYVVMYKKKKKNYALQIFSDTPVNENHVARAIREHCLQELESIRFNSKIETFKELSLGLFGTMILRIWFALSHITEGVFLEILTIIGWVAIWEATSRAFLRVPDLYHQKKEHEFVSKADIIIEVTSPDI